MKKGGNFSKKVGGKPDGARKSKKGQTTALLPQNKMSKTMRQKRIAKAEKADYAV